MTIEILLLILLVTSIGILVWTNHKHFSALDDRDREIAQLAKQLEANYPNKCCACGKPYEPKNDPDYTPELNLCRDCLWILYYETFFNEFTEEGRS